jgi:hypothetical protein
MFVHEDVNKCVQNFSKSAKKLLSYSENARGKEKHCIVQNLKNLDYLLSVHRPILSMQITLSLLGQIMAKWPHMVPLPNGTKIVGA